MKWLLGLGLFALLLAAAPRAPLDTAEMEARLATAGRLARGSLDIAHAPPRAFAATRVSQGRRFATAPLGGALALVPAVALVDARSHSVWLSALLESATSALEAALLCVLFFGALQRLGVGLTTSLLATLALAFTTSVFVYARVPDGSVGAALLLFAALQAARATWEEPRRAGWFSGSATPFLLVGLAGGAAVLLEPACVLPALVLVAGAALRSRRRRAAIWALGPLGLCVAIAIAHRSIAGLTPPPGDLSEGIFGLVASTGKSVFLYNPPLFLAPLAFAALWRTRRADAALSLALIAALLFAVASSSSWHGDPAWGPRRILPAVPLALEPVALWVDGLTGRARRALVGAICLAGLWVQAIGLALPPTDYLRLLSAVRNATGAPLWFANTPSECHFIPEFSPLLGQRWLLAHLARGDLDGARDAPWRLLVASTPKLEAEWPRLRIDWWALAAPRSTAAAGLGALGGVALLSALGLLRALSVMRALSVTRALSVMRSRARRS